MKHMQTMSESGRDIYEDEDELKLDYKVEREPIQWIDSLPTDNYRFLSEIFRYAAILIVICVILIILSHLIDSVVIHVSTD